LAETEKYRGITGNHFDIQRYSIHDGPGIRTTVFLKGCPLSCPWCHNPESHAAHPEISFLPGRCIRCGSCLEVCPHPATSGSDGTPVINPLQCVRCGECVDACPTGARELLGRTVDVQEILKEVERDRPFYEESGGGVTFSGGEPLLQSEFLLACLRESRERGLHTAVDTSGYAPREVILEVAAWTDLFLYDLKILDDARHRKYTGVAVAPVLENLRAIDATGAEIWLRVPLIPGINTDAANLEGLGDFAASLKRRYTVHLLPFHGMGSEKYRRLGRDHPLRSPRPLDPGILEEAAEIFRARGLRVHRGG